MIDILRKNIKLIMGFFAGLTLASGMCVYAYTYIASDIEYTRAGTSLQNTKQALDSLYTATTKCPFPVGYRYQSTVEINLANEYPGTTWEPIKDVFLLTAGDTYTAGSTGGEATHTLTVAETPKHTHTRGTMEITGYFNHCRDFDNGPSGAFYINYTSPTGPAGAGDTGHYWQGLNFQASRSWSGATSSVGGDGAHNNMPPYYVIYGYQRTA